MGETPLVRAAHNGHLAAVQLLLARGADVEAANFAANPEDPDPSPSLALTLHSRPASPNKIFLAFSGCT